MAQFTQTEIKYLISKLKELENEHYVNHQKCVIEKKLPKSIGKENEKEFWSMLHYGRYRNVQQMLEWLQMLNQPRKQPLPFVPTKKVVKRK
jgi:hypothetical protein